ncbi:dna helicase pif1, atp-dependent [Trichoderma arundinaceum]|uniref:Dna helicase pif1, atp-dependent n=1 Tax=Trichoderma arundinaceum TaxID=490622 RepID=A0A395NBE8_TRIAR|nr:dna helicase pif1, atp-dependent [Trichoderma arundinaceum]
MRSGLPAGVVPLNNLDAGQPRRPGSRQSSSLQPPDLQSVGRGLGRMPSPSRPINIPQPSVQRSLHAPLISPHNARSLHQSIPERQPRRSIDVFDIRGDNITEAEARKRLSSYIVIRMERSANPYDVDDEGNPVRPTWEKASHTVQRDISQREARRKVQELDKETHPVTDKKNELSSAIQRQLEYAWNKLEDAEADRRFVYTLAQLDWKLKRVEASGERYKRHDKRNRDKKRNKERLRSKEPSSRSKPKKERVSVTAYFKREPARNVNCVRVFQNQQMEIRGGGGLPLNGHPPMAMPAQPPLSRPVHFDPIRPSPQSRRPVFEHQVECRFPLEKLPNAVVNHPNASAFPHHHVPPPQPIPPPPVRNPPLALPQSSPTASPPNVARNSIPQAIEEQNRRIQLKAPKSERRATSGSQNSRSSVTSFSSFSSDDSENNLTPNSSLEPSSYHHERRRGRSRYRQHRSGGESFGLEVARHERPHDSTDRFNGVPPPAPDPIKAVPEADILRRIEQRAYRGGMMDVQEIARSMPTRNSSRQPKAVQASPENRRAPHYHTSRYSMGSEDIGRLGGRLARTTLVDGPRSYQEQAHEPAIYYEYRELPRRYHDGINDDLLISGSNRNSWKRQDAHRYMAGRQRSDQDAWDLGIDPPLRYMENQRRATDSK